MCVLLEREPPARIVAAIATASAAAPTAAWPATTTGAAATRCATGAAEAAPLAVRHGDLGQQFLRYRCHRNPPTDVAFDIGQRLHEVFAAETDRVALGAGTRRAADAMYVVFGILWQVVIEHVADVGNVQAA